MRVALLRRDFTTEFWIYIRSINVLLLLSPVTGADRISGYAPLLPHELEGGGYGLYSYLLLTDPQEHERNIAAVSAALSYLPVVTDLAFYWPRQNVNVTYVPLISAVSKSGSTAEWILEHYDFVRAASLSSKIRGTRGRGLYIISVTKPLSGPQGAPSQYLLQDLSPVPPRLIAPWFKAFVGQAAQQGFWQNRDSATLILRLRTALGGAGDALQDTMARLVVWAGSGKK